MEVRATLLQATHVPSIRGWLPLVRCRRFPTGGFRDSEPMNREKGFTLIELMIALVIVAILATVAVSSYQFAVRRGNRSDAQSFMLDVAQRQQQILLDSRRYQAVANNADFAAINISVPARVSTYYTFEVRVPGCPRPPADCAVPLGPVPPSFTVLATPVAGPQTVDGPLRLDSDGFKSPADRW